MKKIIVTAALGLLAITAQSQVQFGQKEMFFDWKAAGERHADGNIYKSIEINKDRFKLSKQTVDIFKNTAERLGY